jgi:hypothetical protein
VIDWDGKTIRSFYVHRWKKIGTIWQDKKTNISYLGRGRKRKRIGIQKYV